LSTGGYAVGATTVVIVVAATTVAGMAWRRRLLPRATGPVAVTGSLVIAVSVLVVTAEVLGTIGWFSRWPLVCGTVVAAVASVVATRGRTADPQPPRSAARPEPALRSLVGAAATASVALLAAQAVISIRSAARSGVQFADAVAYHLPWAAQFASTHHTTTIVHFEPGAATSYYPLNDELLHGIGMALLGRDSLSLLLGPLTVGAVLLAAYAAGAPFGRGSLAICVVAPLVAAYGGLVASGTNDWAAIWPLVAAVALLLSAAHQSETPTLRATIGPTELFVVGLALGLAAGAKFSLLGPVAVLAIAVVAVIRHRRWIALAVVTGGAVLSGGYWFVRNAADTGTPLPTTHVPGLARVPMSVIDKYGYSVAHYLGDRHVISTYFLPGLRNAFGPLWPLLFVLVAAGLVLAVRRPLDGFRVAIAVTAVVGLAAYVVTPTTALGAPGAPVLFPQNTRYAWPELVLGLVLLAVARLPRAAVPVVVLLSLAVLVARLSRSDSWAADASRRTVVVAVAISLAVAAAGALLMTTRLLPSPVTLAAAFAVVAVLVGYPLQQRYLEDRYHRPANAVGAFLAYMQRYHDISIGVVGVAELYPLYGPTWSNDVTYIGQLSSDHSFEDYHSCTAFAAALQRGGFRVVAIGLDRPLRITGAQDWLAADSAAAQVFHNTAAVVFTVQPGAGPPACAARD
jgi:hypothetical protein